MNMSSLNFTIIVKQLLHNNDTCNGLVYINIMHLDLIIIHIPLLSGYLKSIHLNRLQNEIGKIPMK